MTVTLRHFLHRTETKKLYRTLLKTARAAPSPHVQQTLTHEIRAQFRADATSQSHTDHTQAAFLLTSGYQKLTDLRKMLHLAH